VDGECICVPAQIPFIVLPPQTTLYTLFEGVHKEEY